MKWTIRQVYGVNSFNVSTTKDMLQALQMYTTVYNDTIYAETQNTHNTIQYVSVKDWPPFYIVKHYGWKGIDYDMRGMVHIDAKTGRKISYNGKLPANLIYDIQQAINKA